VASRRINPFYPTEWIGTVTDVESLDTSDHARPTTPRWTHIALPCFDLDATLAWYERFTPLRLLDRRADEHGQSAWIGHPDGGDRPFVLVLVSFVEHHARGKQPTMAPFAHIGIELPTKDDVDQVASRGRAAGCLQWEPELLPPPVGYVCALADPDGNMVEFSFDQGVYERARAVWGD
jgi:lactoylglutathione lyase